MKKILLILFVFTCTVSFSQTIDTLAIQDFEVSPTSPTWNFTGTPAYNTLGISAANNAPANSPTGINNSRSWETTSVISGITLTFSNIIIPMGYDSLRVHFNLAAMNLNGTSGGPDNADYVLAAVSTDGGANYYSRMRIRGAVTDNSFWPFSATGVANLYYQPQTEVDFEPANSGLQTTEGYSNCEIVFPGSVTQISIRITGRSSGTSDTWLIDNVVLTGERVSVGINDLSSTDKLRIYPNPATDKLQISRSNNNLVSIRLYNVLGVLAFSEEISTQDHTLDLSAYPNGIYFLNMGNYIQKIIKQ